MQMEIKPIRFPYGKVIKFFTFLSSPIKPKGRDWTESLGTECERCISKDSFTADLNTRIIKTAKLISQLLPAETEPIPSPTTKSNSLILSDIQSSHAPKRLNLPIILAN